MQPFSNISREVKLSYDNGLLRGLFQQPFSMGINVDIRDQYSRLAIILFTANLVFDLPEFAKRFYLKSDISPQVETFDRISAVVRSDPIFVQKSVEFRDKLVQSYPLRRLEHWFSIDDLDKEIEDAIDRYLSSEDADPEVISAVNRFNSPRGGRFGGLRSSILQSLAEVHYSHTSVALLDFTELPNRESYDIQSFARHSIPSVLGKSYDSVDGQEYRFQNTALYTSLINMSLYSIALLREQTSSILAPLTQNNDSVRDTNSSWKELFEIETQNILFAYSHTGDETVGASAKVISGQLLPSPILVARICEDGQDFLFPIPLYGPSVYGTENLVDYCFTDAHYSHQAPPSLSRAPSTSKTFNSGVNTAAVYPGLQIGNTDNADLAYYVVRVPARILLRGIDDSSVNKQAPSDSQVLENPNAVTKRELAEEYSKLASLIDGLKSDNSEIKARLDLSANTILELTKRANDDLTIREKLDTVLRFITSHVEDTRELLSSIRDLDLITEIETD